MSTTKSNILRRALCLLLAVLCVLCSATVSFATDEDKVKTPEEFTAITKNIKDVGDSVLTQIKNIVVTVGSVALAICGLMFVFGSQRTAENAKSWAFRILVGIAVVMMANLIITGTKSLFESKTTTNTQTAMIVRTIE